MLNLLKNPITKHIHNYIQQFDSIYYSFINNMVEPVFSERIDTAAVVLSNKLNNLCVSFLFNEKFWERLNYNEKCFLFTHETLHVIYDHGYRGEIFINSLEENSRSFELLNIAQDICINHISLEQYIRVPRSALPITEKICFIDTVFKEEDVPNIKKGQSFEYYYLKYLQLYGLKEPLPKVDTIDNHNLRSEKSKDAPGFSELHDKLEEYGIEVDETDDSSKNQISKNYSIFNSVSNGEEKSSEVKKEKSLDDIFKIVIKTAFSKKYDRKRKTNWYRHNRRTAFCFSGKDNLTIPTIHEEKKFAPEKHKICVFLDLSGSCSRYSKKFMELVFNLPEDKYETTVYVFASSISLAERKNNKIIYANVGGGTEIYKVVNTYKKIKDENFDAIFILTDGYYSNIRNLDMDNKKWIFFMTPNHDKNILSGAEVLPLPNKI